jgi:hypothetical protein
MRNRIIVNNQKTKYLCIETEVENLVIEGNKEVRTWKEYKYLGIILNQEGTDDQEINNKITKARKMIEGCRERCLNSIL